MIRILVLDDHEIVRVALKTTLKDIFPDALITDRGSVDLAVKALQKDIYDLMLLDMGLGDSSFEKMLEPFIKVSPQTRIIVYTQNNPLFYARRVLGLGAYGFVSKSAPEHELEKALKIIQGGKKYVQPELFDPSIENPFEVLSNREFDIMLLIAKGNSPAEVSQMLGVMPSTVATHEKNIRRKLNLQSKADITRMALTFSLWI